MSALEVMREQAGARIVRTMTNGRMRLTSHYESEQEFLDRLAEKNEDAQTYGQPEWRAI